MTINLIADLIFLAGFAQLGVLVAAMQVPAASLPCCGFFRAEHVNAAELAGDGPLARGICGYIAG